jgi:hypothetical protein
VFENRVLRRIFGLTREKVFGLQRVEIFMLTEKCTGEKQHVFFGNLYSLPVFEVSFISCDISVELFLHCHLCRITLLILAESS